MKYITLFSLIIVLSLTICSCKKTTPQDEVLQAQDTLNIEKVIIDSVTSKEEIVKQVKTDVEVLKEVKKEPTVVKNPETPKIIVKEVVKKPIETNKEVIIKEIVKKELPADKEVEKVIEIKKEAEVVVEKQKEVISTSNWKVPENYKIMKNPLEASKDNLKEAKIVYDIQCKSCHGAKGLGDGPKAKSMKGDLGDFSTAKFHTQTDGELFYKTKIGRADMPGYAKKLSDEDIWLTVLYMRSLKK